MPEQFTFDFTASEEARLKRLAKEYKEKIGVDPLIRAFDEATILAGLADPDAELLRLRAIDTDSDHEETRRTYRR